MRAVTERSRSVRGALPIGVAKDGMIARTLRVRPEDVVFVKGVVEASDGLAAMFAERGGDLTLAAPADRAAELDELLADLESDIGARSGSIA